MVKTHKSEREHMFCEQKLAKRQKRRECFVVFFRRVVVCAPLRAPKQQQQNNHTNGIHILRELETHTERERPRLHRYLNSICMTLAWLKCWVVALSL